MIEFHLPWPARELSPNARVHFQVKAKATKAARESAYWTACVPAKTIQTSGDGLIALHVTYYPPDRRRRDLDGMFSSSKAYFDGIADALCVNDHRFAFHIMRADPVKNGKVIISIDTPENHPISRSNLFRGEG